MADVPVHHIPGPPAEAGFAHGRLIADLLEPAFLRAYIAQLGDAIGFSREDLAAQALRWREGLPVQHQEEIAGMAAGAGIGVEAVTEFLYADIARPTPGLATRNARNAGAENDAMLTAAPVPDGPMCSALISRLDDGDTWIARNCDWLVPTLMRGTSAVVHETPHRIPVMAVGIRGDIDVDTGLNAERIWLHLHTLQARDDPPPDRTCISWLFWAREALETCASLDELERFIETTGRDRGVFAIAGDGKTNEAAIFECSRADHVRHDIDPAAPACVTNHSLAKVVDERVDAPRRLGGTVGRYRALRDGLRSRRPQRGPDDLIELLAAPDVEMITPKWLRTIYSAVVSPRDARLWFAAGGADGTPAASGGRAGHPVVPPWA